MPNTNNIVVIAHNVRSCHNVGALLRVANGCGVSEVILTGYTPYPLTQNDERLPHIAQKLHQQIHKTALGAEETTPWRYVVDPAVVIRKLKKDAFHVVALEQDSASTSLATFVSPPKLAIILGEEVAGVAKDILADCDEIVEIPMLGDKESHNVVQAAAIALFWARFNH